MGITYKSKNPHQFRLFVAGIAVNLLSACGNANIQQNIADRPFPQALTRARWCEADEEAQANSRISPDLRRRYAEAAMLNGCYGEPVSKPGYQKAGAGLEQFQSAQERCVQRAQSAERSERGTILGPKAALSSQAFSDCMQLDGWEPIAKKPP